MWSRSSDDDLGRAVEVREHSVRRVPVVNEAQHAVGIVSIGDLAIERDPESALGDISAARPDKPRVLLHTMVV
ncbi:CBS domain-containing protein [Streptomyces sp. RLB3-17]|nr:CBS domain-containing protein [Streptomyces sp. S1A1-7]QDN94683.1 CBS domain-containing protein [Streptomyces sp. RLB3-6]QDO04951.1 CBS domain-containing protein [Streptomyces sp. RLB1-9]QDO15102.1 CBS domain-containing protein [Streptomyces sp. S1D4-23]QDO26740.1 CBS domain-containing protein [Streptomyces sp. S1A1-8]QDO36853.1 CBS domain-containing protein [Streptomyces sp. S1A1-3]QDO46899.1 CBS domain-containing protein [Streptomyces sp. RLB3-17]